VRIREIRGMKTLTTLFSLFMLLAILQGCAKDEADTTLVKPDNCDASGEMSYSQVYDNIIKPRCVWCHYPGSGIYDFSRYEVLADRVRSGRLEERLLMPKDEPLHMPPYEEMDPCDLYKIRLWIQQGYKNN
jgi:hypothetical protein